MQRKLFVWIAHHSLLIAGCVIFGLPFLWLVNTSFKLDDELYQDRVLPELPQPADKSPGLYRDDRPDPELDVTAALHENEAVAKALYYRVRARVEHETPAALAAVVTDEDVEIAVDEVTRTVRVGRVHVFDKLGEEYRLTGSWATSGDVSLVGDEVHYAWTEEGGAGMLTMRLALPFEEKALQRIVVPIQGDKSWHAVDARIEVDGHVYESAETRHLRSRRWLEMAWNLPGRDRDAREEARTSARGYREMIPLVETKEPATGQSRLDVTLSRSAVPGGPKLAANYADTFRRIPFWTFAFNSLLLVLLNVIGALVVCPLIAYAFARIEWPGRDVFFVILLATMMIPAQVTMVPVFLIYKTLGWHDTFKPLFIQSFFGSAFFIFLLRQFMKSIPKDLERAARLDGCGFWGVYRHVVLPLIKPSLAAIAIFQFQASWNEFLRPLIYVSSQKLYPLALGLFELKQVHSVEYGMMTASSLMMTLPVILVFLFAQRYFIEGVTLTGIKG